MIGKSWIREQGLQDPLLVEALRQRGWEDVPLWRDGAHQDQPEQIGRAHV